MADNKPVCPEDEAAIEACFDAFNGAIGQAVTRLVQEHGPTYIPTIGIALDLLVASLVNLRRPGEGEWADWCLADLADKDPDLWRRAQDAVADAVKRARAGVQFMELSTASKNH